PLGRRAVARDGPNRPTSHGPGPEGLGSVGVVGDENGDAGGQPWARTSARLSMRPVTVCSRATAPIREPTERAAAAVTGPMHAASASLNNRSRTSRGRMPPRWVAADALVN